MKLDLRYEGTFRTTAKSKKSNEANQTLKSDQAKSDQVSETEKQ